jgi:hypothetical protein
MCSAGTWGKVREAPTANIAAVRLVGGREEGVETTILEGVGVEPMEANDYIV